MNRYPFKIGIGTIISLIRIVIMINTVLLLNLNYIAVAVALLISDILWLRSVLICAGASLISYGILTGNNTVVAWNSLFVTINIIQVIRILIERKPITIDPEIIDLYNTVFSEMTKHEFIYFWKNGKTGSITDSTICTKGEIQENLFLVISGIAVVKKGGNDIAYLVRGSFIAEMAFITSKPASADVVSEGTVEYIAWSRETIKRMKKVYPDLSNKLQLILSKDLINKLAVYQ